MNPLHLRVDNCSIETSDNGTLWRDVQPPLDDAETAHFIAAMLSRAWREKQIPQAPVVTLSGAQTLMEVIREEIDQELAMIADAAPGRKDDADGWALTFGALDTLTSIELHEDGSVTLDYDQAFCLRDTLIAALETAEDLEGGTLARELREHGCRLQSVGLPLTLVFGDGYTIELVSARDESAYQVSLGDEFGSSARTLAEGYEVIRKHRGPPIGTQLSLEENS